jgi:hypothetical protein
MPGTRSLRLLTPQHHGPPDRSLHHIIDSMAPSTASLRSPTAQSAASMAPDPSLHSVTPISERALLESRCALLRSAVVFPAVHLGFSTLPVIPHPHSSNEPSLTVLSYIHPLPHSPARLHSSTPFPPWTLLCRLPHRPPSLPTTAPQSLMPHRHALQRLGNILAAHARSHSLRARTGFVTSAKCMPSLLPR